MRIILDTNEYIFGLDRETGEEAPARVLDAIRILIEESEEFRLLVPEIIRKEVQRNIPEDLEGDFYRHIYRDLDIREFIPVNAEEFLTVLEEG